MGRLKMSKIKLKDLLAPQVVLKFEKKFILFQLISQIDTKVSLKKLRKFYINKISIVYSLRNIIFI